MKGERPEAGFSPLLLYKSRLRNDCEDFKFDKQYLEGKYGADPYLRRNYRFGKGWRLRKPEQNRGEKPAQEKPTQFIEYEHLCQYAKGIDWNMLDEIVTLLTETVCSVRKTIRIAGDDYPAELVKSRLMKLDSTHIEFVFDQ